MNDVALVVFLVFAQRERERARVCGFLCVVESFVAVVVVERVCVCVCVCVYFLIFSLVASKTHENTRVFF